MRTVHRYVIPPELPTEDGYFSLEMSIGAVPLHVAVQERAPHSPCMWVLVDLDREPVQRRFMITGTGTSSPEPPASKSEYIGTFQQMGYVWHIWETP